MSAVDPRQHLPDLLPEQAAITFVAIPAVHRWRRTSDTGSEVWRVDATSAHFERLKASTPESDIVDVRSTVDQGTMLRARTMLDAFVGTSLLVRHDAGYACVEHVCAGIDNDHTYNILNSSITLQSMTNFLPTEDTEEGNVYQIHDSLVVELTEGRVPYRVPRPFSVRPPCASPFDSVLRAYERLMIPRCAILALETAPTPCFDSEEYEEVELVHELTLRTDAKLRGWGQHYADRTHVMLQSRPLQLTCFEGPLSGRDAFRRWLNEKANSISTRKRSATDFVRFAAVIAHEPPIEHELSHTFFEMMRGQRPHDVVGVFGQFVESRFKF